MHDKPLPGDCSAENTASVNGGAEANRGIGFPRLYDLLLLIMTRGRDPAYRAESLDLAGIAPGHDVLDVGCGTGTLAVAAYSRVQPGGSVVGIDISPNMLALAHRAGLDIPFRRARGRGPVAVRQRPVRCRHHHDRDAHVARKPASAVSK